MCINQSKMVLKKKKKSKGIAYTYANSHPSSLRYTSFLCDLTDLQAFAPPLVL